MVHAPGSVVFHFQIKNHIVLLRKFQNLFQRRDPLAHELAVKPHSRIQLTQLRQSKVVDIAPPVAGALQGSVMNRHEPRVARQVQVGFNKSSPQFDGALISRERVLRGMPGRPAMRNDPRFSHDLGYPSREIRPATYRVLRRVMQIALRCQLERSPPYTGFTG